MLGGRAALTVVAAQLGHADPAVTARIHAHLVDASTSPPPPFERSGAGLRAVRLVEEPSSEA